MKSSFINLFYGLSKKQTNIDKTNNNNLPGDMTTAEVRRESSGGSFITLSSINKVYRGILK